MQHLTEKPLNSSILKTISLVATLVFVCAFASPAGDYSLVSSMPVEADFLTTDFLKNAYVINGKNQVMKYDSTGNLVGVHNDNRFGEISSIDATSPFNVLFFYKDFGTLITADMKLSIRRLYKLSSVGINNISAACLSFDNFIWVYDLDEGKLKKINHNYEVIYESLDMNQMLGERIEPNFLIERDNFIFMNLPGVGVILFDSYGNYYSSISSTDLGKNDLRSFQVVNYKMVYFDDGKLYIYDVQTGDLDITPIPKAKQSKMVSVEKGRLYLLTDDELQFYSLLK